MGEKRSASKSSRRTHVNFDQRCTWQSVQNHSPEPEIPGSNMPPSGLNNVFLKWGRETRRPGETDCCGRTKFSFHFHLDVLIANVDHRDSGPGKEIRDSFYYPCNSPPALPFLPVACSFLSVVCLFLPYLPVESLFPGYVYTRQACFMISNSSNKCYFLYIDQDIFARYTNTWEA